MGFALSWGTRLWTEQIRAKIPARIGIVRGRPINRPARDQETARPRGANLFRRGTAGSEQPIVLPQIEKFRHDSRGQAIREVAMAFVLADPFNSEIAARNKLE